MKLQIKEKKGGGGNNGVFETLIATIRSRRNRINGKL